MSASSTSLVTGKVVAAVCLAGSGACALVYQTAWLRSLDGVVGDSAAAAAVVLALFMGGSGIGGLLLGRRLERARRPLLTYACIELAVAAAAGISPSLFGGEQPGSLIAMLALPVVLLGGTLPAAARVVTGDNDVGRKGLAAIYGLHSLGAVVGALASAIFVLDALGAVVTVRAAASIHGALGMFALVAALRLERVAPPPISALTAHAPHAGNVPHGHQPQPGRAAWVLGVAFVTGFVFFLAEVGWARASLSSSSGFGVVLATALAGLAVAGVAYAWAGPRHPTPAHLAVTCALEAVCLLLPLALFDDVGTRQSDWGVWLVVILVLPASLVAGWQYPMLLALKGRGAEGVGKDSGDVAAANTLGAIVGALCGGFLPSFASGGLWVGCGCSLVFVACCAAVFARRDRARALTATALGLCALGCLPSTSRVASHPAAETPDAAHPVTVAGAVDER